MQTEQTDSSGDEAAAVDVHQLEDLLRAEAPDHAGVILVVGLPPALGQTPHDLLARLYKQGIWHGIMGRRFPDNFLFFRPRLDV